MGGENLIRRRGMVLGGCCQLCSCEGQHMVLKQLSLRLDIKIKHLCSRIGLFTEKVASA